jgi:hypothetical protein
MVGGLKRADGTVRPASDLTASKEVSTSDRVDQQGAEAGPSRSGSGNGNENGQADAEEEVVGSPDWPSDVEEDEEAERPVGRGREAVPSRSPSPVGNEDVVWHDPLDEDEDDEDGDVADGPPAKRRRDS